MAKSPKHSPAWWEGYHCQGPKMRNPYAAGQPWLAEHSDPVLLNKFIQWKEGWECRYYGEKP